MIDKDLLKNIEWVHKARTLKGMPDLNQNKITLIEGALREEIATNNRGIAAIASKVSGDLGLIPGTGLYVVRYLIANRIWEVNMYIPIGPYSTLNILKFNLEKIMV